MASTSTSTDVTTLNEITPVDGSSDGAAGSTSSSLLSWNSSLTISGCVLCPKQETYEDHQAESTPMDIFQYSTPDHKYWLKTWVIRFDPQRYRINPEVEDKFSRDSDGWKLVQEIIQSLKDSGQGTFVSNGANHKNRFGQRQLCCSRYKMHQQRIPKPTDHPRPPRPVLRTALCKEDKCTCRIVVKADTNSYYVDCGTGNAQHRQHPRPGIPPVVAAVASSTPRRRRGRPPRRSEKAPSPPPDDNDDDTVTDDPTEDHDDGHFQVMTNDDDDDDVTSDVDPPYHHDPEIPDIPFPARRHAAQRRDEPYQQPPPPRQPRRSSHDYHRPALTTAATTATITPMEELCSLLLYCDDDYYLQIQQEMENMVYRTKRHIWMRQQQQQQQYGRNI